MAQPRHIEIAREQGAKAGFNSWVEQMERSGLPQVREALDEVRAQGNKKAQFDYYCAKFGSRFGHTQARNDDADVDDDDPSDAVKAIANALGIDVDKLVALTGTTGETTKPKTRQKRQARKAAPAPADVDVFAPSDPDMLSTPGRLWKLNEAGLLIIADTPDLSDRITAGEAHEALKAHGVKPKNPPQARTTRRKRSGSRS